MRITGQRRPDRGAIERSGAHRDYPMSPSVVEGPLHEVSRQYGAFGVREATLRRGILSADGRFSTTVFDQLQQIFQNQNGR